MNLHKITQTRGLTLIELLVVVSIMVVLMALLIPQVRMVTKDRAAREAARIVGSALSDASSKARVDGFAGIAIARNTNVVRDNGNPATGQIHYAGYQLFQLRQPPSYVGNEVGDSANVIENIPRDYATGTPGEIEIVFPTPLDPNIAATVTNGFVRLNGSKTLYRITSTTFGPNMGVLCEVPWHLEMPAAAAGVPFELVRDPVLRQTSQVDLPNGYMINLNYSGPIDHLDVDSNTWTWTAFSQSDGSAPTGAIYIIFDDQGGIDRIYPNGLASTPFFPDGSLHLCIAPDLVKHKFSATNLSDAMLVPNNPTDVLDDSAVKWVTINHLNGSVVVTNNTPPVTAFTSGDSAAVVETKKLTRLLESLTISGDRQAATQ